MNAVKEIQNYILFLKEHHNLSITLHPLKDEAVISPSELMCFNIHDNSYCVYLKTCPAARCHCIRRQPKILDKLNQEESFVGVCYAGVKEYVYPIFDGKEKIGFISVSGYQTSDPNRYLKRVSEQYGFSQTILQEVYFSLEKEPPEKECVDTLVFPLCRMLELAYRKTEQMPKRELTLPEKVIAYLKLHRNEDITSEDICKALYCSRTYMSSQFNHFTKKSIRDYINELRIEDAKFLLQNSELNITEVALSVGYSDSNYFSNVFKKITGISPMKFRKKG